MLSKMRATRRISMAVERKVGPQVLAGWCQDEQHSRIQVATDGTRMKHGSEREPLGRGVGVGKAGGFQCFSPRRQILQKSGKRILDGWFRSGGTAVRAFNHGRHGSTPKGRISGGSGWLVLTLISGSAGRPNSRFQYPKNDSWSSPFAFALLPCRSV
jgi:hypothetical protein